MYEMKVPHMLHAHESFPILTFQEEFEQEEHDPGCTVYLDDSNSLY